MEDFLNEAWYWYSTLGGLAIIIALAIGVGELLERRQQTRR